jgi:hypothetical protein
MQFAHPAKHGLDATRFDLDGRIFVNKIPQGSLKLLEVTIHLRTDRHRDYEVAVGFGFAHDAPFSITGVV